MSFGKLKVMGPKTNNGSGYDSVTEILMRLH